MLSASPSLELHCPSAAVPVSGVTSLSVLGHFVQGLGREEDRGAGTRRGFVLNVPWAYPFAGAGFTPPCTGARVEGWRGRFSTRALPLSPVSADLYVRSGLELDSSKMAQAVAL